MRQPSSPRYRLRGVRSTMAALLTAGGLALAIVPAPAWAASNVAHLDRQVLKAMQAGAAIPLVFGFRGGNHAPPDGLTRTACQHTPRPPAIPRIAPPTTTGLA